MHLKCTHLRQVVHYTKLPLQVRLRRIEREKNKKSHSKMNVVQNKVCERKCVLPFCSCSKDSITKKRLVWGISGAFRTLVKASSRCHCISRQLHHLQRHCPKDGGYDD